MSYHIIIIRLLISTQVQAGAGASSTSVGPFPGNWLTGKGPTDVDDDIRVSNCIFFFSENMRKNPMFHQ